MEFKSDLPPCFIWKLLFLEMAHWTLVLWAHPGDWFYIGVAGGVGPSGLYHKPGTLRMRIYNSSPVFKFLLYGLMDILHRPQWSWARGEGGTGPGAKKAYSGRLLRTVWSGLSWRCWVLIVPWVTYCSFRDHGPEWPSFPRLACRGMCFPIETTF